VKLHSIHRIASYNIIKYTQYKNTTPNRTPYKNISRKTDVEVFCCMNLINKQNKADMYIVCSNEAEK